MTGTGLDKPFRTVIRRDSGWTNKSSGQTICTAPAARRVAPREGRNERTGMYSQRVLKGLSKPVGARIDLVDHLLDYLSVAFNKRDKTDRQDVRDLDLAGVLFFQHLQ